MTERAIERIIREAIERGEFDGLPGTGKPLDLSDADDPDWWIKRLIKREQLDTSGGLPGVFGLRRERESFPESLLELRTEAAVREVLEDYNRRVKVDRITNLPPKGARSTVVAGLVDVDEMTARWTRRRTELAAQSEAAAAAVRAAQQSPLPTHDPSQRGGRDAVRRLRRRLGWLLRRPRAPR